MTRLLMPSAAAILALVAHAQAGNTSSNSSSNSSNGVHTRVDTVVTDGPYGRRVYERRVYRRDPPPSYRNVRQRRVIADDDD